MAGFDKCVRCSHPAGVHTETRGTANAACGSAGCGCNAFQAGSARAVDGEIQERR